MILQFQYQGLIENIIVHNVSYFCMSLHIQFYCYEGDLGREIHIEIYKNIDYLRIDGALLYNAI